MKWTFNPFPLEFLASLRTAVYVTLIGVSLSPGMAVGDEEETGVPEGFAIFVHGDEPGHLEIDGSNLNAMLQLPEEPRHFYSADEFVEFAIQELNASVVLDELGIPVGVEGFLTVTDTLLTVDPATHEILEVKDPIAAFLGGQFGYFFIGEEKVCLDPAGDGCEEQLVDAGEFEGPASSLQSLFFQPTSSTYSISGVSTYINLLFYKTVGSSTHQKKGGWKKSTYFCWKWGFIPWVCSKTSGWNELWVESEFFSFLRQPMHHLTLSKTKRNVSSVSVNHWGLFFPLPGCAWTPQLCAIGGVRGSHWGQGSGGSHSTSSCRKAGC